MEPKLQRWVQRRGWDRASSSYERYWQTQLQPALELLLTTADLHPGENVIDVACGTGLVTLPAAARVAPGGRVLGADLSPKMIADLERNATAAGLTNVEVACCDAEHLDVDLAVDMVIDGAFDVALCSLGLMYVPGPDAAARELHRALRPGGRAVVSVWGARRNCGWAELFPIVDARVSSDVCPMFFALGTPGALTSILATAGFIGIEETRLQVELAYADDAEALGAAFHGGPVALAHSKFDEATRQSAYAEYLASLTPFAEGSGYRVPGEFVVASARRTDTAADRTSTRKEANHDHDQYPRRQRRQHRSTARSTRSSEQRAGGG